MTPLQEALRDMLADIGKQELLPQYHLVQAPAEVEQNYDANGAPVDAPNLYELYPVFAYEL